MGTDRKRDLEDKLFDGSATKREAEQAKERARLIAVRNAEAAKDVAAYQARMERDKANRAQMDELQKKSR